MFRWIIGSSLKFRFMILAGAVAMMFLGFARLRPMPVDVFPEFAPPQVEIQTEGPGMSSAEVEELITIPMEQVLNGTPGLDVMRSKSVNGAVVDRAAVQARHRRPACAPAGAGAPPAGDPEPAAVAPAAGDAAAAVGDQPGDEDRAVVGHDCRMMDLSMIAYWTIKFRLLRVPGVANVPIWGERIKMCTVQVDPERTAGTACRSNTVMETTSRSPGLRPGAATRGGEDAAPTGFIDTPNQRLDDAARPAGHRAGGRGAVADQGGCDGSDAQASATSPRSCGTTWPMIGDAVINDGPGLMLIVEKFPWANTLDVTRGVEAALESCSPGLPGIEIDSTIFRPATFIELSIDNLTHALLIGCVLVDRWC